MDAQTSHLQNIKLLNKRLPHLDREDQQRALRTIRNLRCQLDGIVPANGAGEIPVDQCIWPDCDRAEVCDGYCGTHYQRKRRGADMSAPIRENGRLKAATR